MDQGLHRQASRRARSPRVRLPLRAWVRRTADALARSRADRRRGRATRRRADERLQAPAPRKGWWPTDGDGTNYNVIVVVLMDLSAERAGGVFDEVLEHIAVPSYVEDGIVFGPFYDGNQATAIYNRGFRPFQSPVPFLFVRHGVVSDWKFFLDKEDWLTLWARRFGEQGVNALAAELRRLPWNARRD